MFASYVVAVRAADMLSGRAVLMTIAALYALMLLAPPLLSTDVFSYQAYARMWALYGANPYLHGPHAIALDPLYPFIGAKWVGTPTAYGPIFTTLSYLLAPLSIAASVLAYKAIAVLASLTTVALVWNAARLRGLDPVKAAALVGLNPLIVVYGVGGGHNDLLMLTALVAGVYALLQQRSRAAGAMIVLGAGIKLTAGLFLPFAIASGRVVGTRSRRRDILIGAGTTAALVAALGFAAFGSGPLHLLGTLLKIQGEGDWHSIPGFISTRLGLGAIGHVAGLVLGVMFIGAFAWLLRRVWRGEMDWIDGAGWATLAMLITASSLLPWYVAWLLPFAALSTDHRLWRASIVMTGVVQGILLLGYIPHGSSLLGL
jgi:alpha-1,6-mannosyltransferase